MTHDDQSPLNPTLPLLRQLGLVWQHGEALVTYKKHGLLGSRLRYLICRRCGAVVYQWVAEPHKFPSIK